MAKKIVGFIKLQVPAGKANPSPPIGPALGQRGLNIMEFCKAFNAQTQSYEPGLPLPVVITAFQDKSFTFVIKTEGLSFPEAVERLAAEAGVALPKPDVREERREEERDRHYRLLEASARFFQTALVGGTGGAARRYIEKRGLLPMQDAPLPKIQFKALAAILPDSDTAVGIVVNDQSNLLDTFEQAWDWRLLLL